MLRMWPRFIESIDDITGMRPLSHAAFIGYLDGVRQILDKSRVSLYLKETKKEGYYPIHIASMKGRVEILEEFLKRRPDSGELCTEKGENILHVAAMHGKTKAVSYILKNPELELLINEKDNNGNTPLHLAAREAHPLVVSILTLDSKVNLQLVNSEGNTARKEASLHFKGNVPPYRKV